MKPCCTHTISKELYKFAKELHAQQLEYHARRYCAWPPVFIYTNILFNAGIFIPQEASTSMRS